MSKIELPDDVENMIWSYVENGINDLNDNMDWRKTCKASMQKFNSMVIEHRVWRDVCRESLCRSKLKDECIFGRYCSIQCYREHLVP